MTQNSTWWPTVLPRSLFGADQQLELALLDLFLEESEARLLTRIEHLVERVVRLPQFRCRTLVVIAERRQGGADRGVLSGRIRTRPHELPQLLNQPQAHPIVPTADILNLLQARREDVVLIVGNRELLLRLHEGVRIERRGQLQVGERIGLGGWRLIGACRRSLRRRLLTLRGRLRKTSSSALETKHGGDE